MSSRTKRGVVVCRVCDLYEDGEGVPCHPCGHMPNSDVLPGCSAVALNRDAYPRGCYCVRPSKKDALVARLERLEARVAELEDAQPGKPMIDLAARRALATPTPARTLSTQADPQGDEPR